ncbi:lipopolysaccharide assembly protein LapA domain-containing protein [Stakelama pacifica]|uniref:Uncharacterized protein DUF1049 n=1 Tax=Stakelama pacifica TaxID=517720 RepID=A0A4R6FCF7_9SPHN|nr:lipopolysaccharide assembly protein LapA domain-containing protein [Stakelama pacifica]TDN77915.1 uncharacterized protein DUF1049 [Stakelama pacifica]GGP00570.1 hypothetical protein GCM10011329_36750 [Stakelama pacifica]
MQFLKTLFWALLIGLGLAFAYNNWVPVDIHLWGGLIAEVNLPLLLLVMFLIGFVPMLLAYHAVRWRLRQRLANAERALNDLRTAQAAPAPVAPAVVEPAHPAPPARSEPRDGSLFDTSSKDDA